MCCIGKAKKLGFLLPAPALCFTLVISVKSNINSAILFKNCIAENKKMDKQEKPIFPNKVAYYRQEE